MKRVKQTAFGRPHGNCFEACLASILELDLDDVPRHTDNDWLEKINQWLRWHFSLQLMVQSPYYAPPNAYIIANGSNQRDRPHSVVMQNGLLVHDPNPDNGGLSDVNNVLIFVAVNPARMQKRAVRGPRTV